MAISQDALSTAATHLEGDVNILENSRNKFKVKVLGAVGLDSFCMDEAKGISCTCSSTHGSSAKAKLQFKTKKVTSSAPVWQKQKNVSLLPGEGLEFRICGTGSQGNQIEGVAVLSNICKFEGDIPVSGPGAASLSISIEELLAEEDEEGNEDNAEEEEEVQNEVDGEEEKVENVDMAKQQENEQAEQADISQQEQIGEAKQHKTEETEPEGDAVENMTPNDVIAGFENLSFSLDGASTIDAVIDVVMEEVSRCISELKPKEAVKQLTDLIKALKSQGSIKIKASSAPCDRIQQKYNTPFAFIEYSEIMNCFICKVGYHDSETVIDEKGDSASRVTLYSWPVQRFLCTLDSLLPHLAAYGQEFLKTGSASAAQEACIEQMMKAAEALERKEKARQEAADRMALMKWGLRVFVPIPLPDIVIPDIFSDLVGVPDMPLKALGEAFPKMALGKLKASLRSVLETLALELESLEIPEDADENAETEEDTEKSKKEQDSKMGKWLKWMKKEEDEKDLKFLVRWQCLRAVYATIPRNTAREKTKCGTVDEILNCFRRDNSQLSDEQIVKSIVLAEGFLKNHLASFGMEGPRAESGKRDFERIRDYDLSPSYWGSPSFEDEAVQFRTGAFGRTKKPSVKVTFTHVEKNRCCGYNCDSVDKQGFFYPKSDESHLKQMFGLAGEDFYTSDVAYTRFNFDQVLAEMESGSENAPKQQTMGQEEDEELEGVEHSVTSER